MRPLFVFCADLHLEDGAWTSRINIYGDAYYSFKQIVDHCIEHKLPLILGGDVLEKKSNAARPIAKLCAELTRMQDAKLPVYYIQGNHEYDRYAPWLSVHPWPTHMHNLTVVFDNVSVHGIDWLPKGEIQKALKDVPATTAVLVTHQVWQDFMGTVGRTECDLSEVHYAHTVLAGDFHVTKVAEGTNAQGKPIRMLSPGSTAMQDIGEEPEKFFFVICVDEAGKIVFAPHRLQTRKFLSYVVKTAEELDELCAGKLANAVDRVLQAARLYVPPELAKPLVRVKFNKNLPDAYLRITTAGADIAHLFCDAIADRDDENKDRPARPRDETKNDLLHAIAELLGDDTDEYRFAQEILAATNPKRLVESHLHEYVKGAGNAAITAGSSELGAPPETGL
jgi:hypothetical protein